MNNAWLREAWGRTRALPWRRIALVTAIVIAVIAVVPPFRRAAALAGSRVVLFVASPLAPGIGGFDDLPATTKILAADGSVLAELDTPTGGRRQPVDLDRLPDHVWQAVLAAEDENFYDHSGVDPGAVFRAMVRSAQGRSQGGSTITQQLAKINYTRSERTVFRKLREVLYASRLEGKYSKDELLERYLNQVYLGDRAYGIAAASESYFGVRPDQLTVAPGRHPRRHDQGPRAARPPHPPGRGPGPARRGAAQHGAQRLADATRARRPRGARRSRSSRPSRRRRRGRRTSSTTSSARRRASTRSAARSESRGHRVFTGGLTIKTTLDPKAFDAAEAAVRKQLGAPEDPATAVVSVQPGDGAIRAMVSGLDPARKFNLADHSGDGRQPGSAFKPFVYLAALRAGIDPRSPIDARSPKQLEFRGERVHRPQLRGQQRGSQRRSTRPSSTPSTPSSPSSCSTPARQSVVKIAETAGIDDPTVRCEDDRNRPAIALGGLRHGVTPLEMAAAYATFAAKGTYAEPYAIAGITDRAGRDVYIHALATRKAFEPKEVGVLNAALMGVVDSGTGTAARIGRPVAGKTGTTQNYGDAWFVGFVPQLSTAVWVGNPEKIVPMRNVHGRSVSGGSFPAAIWAQTMRGALAGVPVEPIATASPDELGLRLLGAHDDARSVDDVVLGAHHAADRHRPARSAGSRPPSPPRPRRRRRRSRRPRPRPGPHRRRRRRRRARRAPRPSRTTRGPSG